MVDAAPAVGLGVLVVISILATTSLLEVAEGSNDGLGVNWGNIASQPLPAEIVVKMLKDNNIKKVKLFDADPKALKALAKSGIEVMVAVPNNELQKIQDYDNAKDWVKENVTEPVKQGVDIRYVAVGNEPFLKGYNGSYLTTLFPALKNIQRALEEKGHADKVKTTVPHNADVYESSSDVPSNGDFRSDIKQNMLEIVNFFKQKGSPFTVNIYPYLSLYQSSGFPVDFAFFDSGNGNKKNLQDNGKTYTNVFDANYDTLVWTLKKNGASGLRIIVGEIGWPTDGEAHATVTLAKRFYQGLSKKLINNVGTPLRPGHIEVYLFGLIDENMKSVAPGPFERHWGIFEYDGTPKFQVDLAGGQGNSKHQLIGAKGVQYLKPQWCVLDWEAKDLSGLPEAMTWSCSMADCTKLDDGASCSDLTANQRASYAFNMYFQMNGQNYDACDFNGLGRLSKQNATTGNCLYPIQIPTAPHHFPLFMANSKYEYVKSFETFDKLIPSLLIVLRINGRQFHKFSEAHHFEKPYDERALNLMNICAAALMEEYPDIVFGYGFGDEFSFILKKESRFYQRRASKILSLVVSFFTSLYTTQWKAYFSTQELKYPPSFQAQVIQCPAAEVLQTYLAWRQNECHLNNLYDTCFWMLMKHGKDEKQAHDILKSTQKQEKNEILFQLGVNYNNVPQIFRQGTCLLKAEVEDVVKFRENGDPVKRRRKKLIELRSENIACRSFWNKQPCLVNEICRFETDAHKLKTEFVESFQSEDKLMPFTWIVVRVDGCHFHRFSDIHTFDKPNDECALELMNACAAAVLKEFKDVIFSYGVSDEYSFVLKKESQLYQRFACKIVSVIVSFFSSNYCLKWKDHFPRKEMKYPPSFDGRAVCYPTTEILRDYLSWRQVDCHINNQYNTCFWALVKSNKSKSEAQLFLKGTQTEEKNKLLKDEFNIEYNDLPPMFRRGSAVFRKKRIGIPVNGRCLDDSQEEIVLEHCDIIGEGFWREHPYILGETQTPTDLRKNYA